MSITPRPPIPSFLPDNAPFSPEQRAWLNGFFAGYLGLDNGGVTALSPEESARLIVTRLEELGLVGTEVAA